MTTFDQAFAAVLGHEGGYVCHPSDPGGETKFGISKRAHPHLDIKALTAADAKAIYRRDYWGPAGCETVPECLRLHLFDAAVNSGVRGAIKMLQRAVGETEDGILGPRTLAAINSMPGTRLVARMSGARLAFMADLPQWPAFGRGWARRIAANLMEV
jgi:lysozyme family protein